MKHFLAGLFAAALCVVPATAEHKKGPVVIAPEDAQWLHEYVRQSGDTIIRIYSNRPDIYTTRTFDIGKPGSCQNLRIEAIPGSLGQLLVFDGFCKYTFVLSEIPYFVWGSLRVVIAVDTGEVMLGAASWIETSPDGTGAAPIFPTEGSIELVLKNHLSDIIEKEKNRLAHQQR